MFVSTPQPWKKPLKPSTKAEVQISLCLVTEDHQDEIFQQLPAGIPPIPPLPLTVGSKNHPILAFDVTYLPLK
jgi:hypothetical protein